MPAAKMTARRTLLYYLETIRQQVRLVESRRFPAVLFGAQNTVFLGMPRNARYLDEILAKTNFYLSVDPDVVRSRNPRPGEPEEYREVTYSSDRRMTPAIIILLPARPEHTRTLLLLGKYITATTSMLVSAEGIKSLDAVWTKAGSPDAWEMVIEAEVYGDTILKSVALSCRPIPATFWK